MTNHKPVKVLNVAFLNELKECNSNLWEDVTILGAYTQEPFCADWIEQNGGTLLRRLRNELSAQYRLEETYGYVYGTGERQEATITKAIDQHLNIVLQCVALSEQFDDLEYCGKLAGDAIDIWRRMKKLYDAIMEHESLERLLSAAAWAPILPGGSQLVASMK
jgi:hypothetical protein